MALKVDRRKVAELEALARQAIAEAERAEDALRASVQTATIQRLTRGEGEALLSFCRKSAAQGDPIALGQLHRSDPPDWATAEEIAAALRFERLYFHVYRQFGGQYAPPDAPCGDEDDEIEGNA